MDRADRGARGGSLNRSASESLDRVREPPFRVIRGDPIPDRRASFPRLVDRLEIHIPRTFSNGFRLPAAPRL